MWWLIVCTGQFVCSAPMPQKDKETCNYVASKYAELSNATKQPLAWNCYPDNPSVTGVRG